MLSVGMLVKKAMKGHVDLLGPAKAVADELTGIPSFETPDYSGLLSEEKVYFGLFRLMLTLTSRKDMIWLSGRSDNSRMRSMR
mgnify:CR=1 FL=1